MISRSDRVRWAKCSYNIPLTHQTEGRIRPAHARPVESGPVGWGGAPGNLGYSLIKTCGEHGLFFCHFI